MSAPDVRLTPDTADALAKLFAEAEARGMTLRIRSARRSCAEQNQLYAQGRTADGNIVTFARGCMSWHVLGRAVDLDIVDGPKDYATLGAIWKTLGGKWGGDFVQGASLNDVGHFELHPGLTIEQACPNPDACSDDGGVGVPISVSAAPVPAWRRALRGALFVGGIAGAGLLAWEASR